jgi:hypothetical protein
LSNSAARRAYDEERWLAGIGGRARHIEAVTPQWILQESKKLREYVSQIDTYRMSHSSLRDYILLILSDAHIAVLHMHSNKVINEGIIEEILLATARLEYQYFPAVAAALQKVANGDEELTLIIQKNELIKKKQSERRKLTPYLIAIITISLCVLMYFYSRHF